MDTGVLISYVIIAMGRSVDAWNKVAFGIVPYQLVLIYLLIDLTILLCNLI